MCKDFPFFKVVLVILTSCHLIHLKEIRQISLPDIIGHIIFIFAVNFFRDLIQPKSNRSNHITLFKLIEKGDTEGFIKFQKENFTNVNELHTCYIYGKVNPLVYAIAHDRYDICKYLLDNGFDINLKTENEEPLIVYSIHKSNIKMIELLLKYKPDLNAKCAKFGSNAIETAVFRNRTKIVALLLQHGATFSLNSYRKSAVSSATKVQMIKPKIMRLLLKFKIFQMKKNEFDIYDKGMNKEINLSIFNMRHYFIENFLKS